MKHMPAFHILFVVHGARQVDDTIDEGRNPKEYERKDGFGIGSFGDAMRIACIVKIND